MKSESMMRNGGRKLASGQATFGVGVVLSLLSYASPISRAVDCNNNTIEDACDISCGTPGGECAVPGCGGSVDCNSNGIPDTCDLAGTNYSLSFDGVDDVVRIPRSASLEPASEFTIEVWIRPSGVGPQNSRLFRIGNPEGYLLAWQQQNDGRLQLRVDQPGGGGLVLKDNVGTSTYLGQWVHVAAVYSASQNKSWLYVNGVVKAQGFTFGVVTYSNGDLQIGNWNPLVNSDEGFPGQIDEARLWNVARTGAEINTWMNHSLRGNEAGLAGYWRFNEASGQSAFDSSASGNHGTLGETSGIDANDPGWQMNGALLTETDCNESGLLDTCDVADAMSPDCNQNAFPDECELSPTTDCNSNGVPDSCDIEDTASEDCNSNGIPDECETDCNTNGVPDDCDVDPSDPDGDQIVFVDCNNNQSPDECDLALLDCNTNEIPDECEFDNQSSSLDFNGLQDLVKVARSSSLEPINEFTIEFWIRPDGLGGDNNTIVTLSGSGAGYALGGSVGGDRRLQMRIYGADLGNIAAVDATHYSNYLGAWHHVAGVYSASGNYCRLYIDGVLKRSTAGVGQLRAYPSRPSAR